MIGKVRGKQIRWETGGWESKPPLRKALLPTQVYKKNANNSSMAATVREQNAIRQGKSRKAMAVRSNRKSFCNGTNSKRKAEKALVCCTEGRKDLNR